MHESRIGLEVARDGWKVLRRGAKILVSSATNMEGTFNICGKANEYVIRSYFVPIKTANLTASPKSYY